MFFDNRVLRILFIVRSFGDFFLSVRSSSSLIPAFSDHKCVNLYPKVLESIFHKADTVYLRKEVQSLTHTRKMKRETNLFKAIYKITDWVD